MKKLNQSYFIIIVIFITILQFFFYDKTLKMDKLQKGTLYIESLSKETLNQIKGDDYTQAVKRLVHKSKDLFTNVYFMVEKQDDDFPFLTQRELKRDLKDTKALHPDNLKHKQIYDACEEPNRIFNFGNEYFIAQKSSGECYVFETSSLLLNYTPVTPLWYVAVCLLLVVMALFIVQPENKKKKLVLSGTLLFQAGLFFLLAYLGINDKVQIEKDILEKVGQISSVSYEILFKLFITVLGILIAFILFYMSKFNERMSNTLIKHKSPYLYILPGGIGILFLSFVPLVSGIMLSFFSVKYNAYQFVWFSNYIDIIVGGFKDILDLKGFYYTFFMTVVWTTVNIFFHVTVGMTIAMVLNRKGLKFKKIYSIIFIIPWAVPNYITALIWKSMFHEQFGAINSFLEMIGIGKISWFSDTFTAFSANLLTNIWLGFPFMMVMTLGALQSIPLDLYDAAKMDGASKWQQFKYITLPMLKPALLPSIILGTIWTFNMFNVIYLVSGGEPQSKTDILITEAYRWAFERNGQYGYSAAYATIIFIVLYLYNHFTSKLGKKGVKK